MPNVLQKTLKGTLLALPPFTAEKLKAATSALVIPTVHTYSSILALLEYRMIIISKDDSAWQLIAHVH